MANLAESDRKSAVRLIAHRPFPELAAALRSCTTRIIQKWMVVVRSVIPTTVDLPDDELRDNLPRIIPKIADVMESSGERDATELMHQSPAQGLARFHQNYDLRDLMTEDRLLRSVIVEELEATIHRRMTEEEGVALHMAVDMMLQEAVVAFIAQQHTQVRTAAEAELKYLSFLSHDLNNNLGVVTLILQALRQRLTGVEGFAADVETLNSAQNSILNTIGGMGRLLQSERLRKAGTKPQPLPVQLAPLVAGVIQLQSNTASAKGIKLVQEIPPECICRTDAELLRLIIQNLLGNAIKYSTHGSVRIHATCTQTQCNVFVSDEGPGISVEHLGRIFESFRRGEGHLQPGVGLGLTIASQAAKLLGGELTVESKVGVGSTFHFKLPM